ncbi:MAG: hypothetical protein K0R69_3173 [Clostridia bacterium]|jgi:hypothetical protein|nr:hypothetical protein [Clostridia bacterium]
MIIIALLCGLLSALLVTNVLIYIIKKVFHHFNYALTYTSYYLLSCILIIILGLGAGFCIVRIIS